VGLGLYIAQAYIQAMGGNIGVRSAPGAGATFWFSLPSAPTSLPLPLDLDDTGDTDGVSHEQPAGSWRAGGDGVKENIVKSTAAGPTTA
ncbi:MAG TPA: ATP-binding protein, partial [Chloroflexota bacterium]|nr:ATP-binding protein [Chloroflexota bacterium]